MSEPCERDPVFHHWPPFSNRISLRFHFELIQAFPAAEPVLTAFVHLGVAFSRLHVHSADRVLCAGLWRSVSCVAAMAMHHVCSASEAHHEVEQCCEQQQREQTFHNASFSARAIGANL